MWLSVALYLSGGRRDGGRNWEGGGFGDVEHEVTRGVQEVTKRAGGRGNGAAVSRIFVATGSEVGGLRGR